MHYTCQCYSTIKAQIKSIPARNASCLSGMFLIRGTLLPSALEQSVQETIPKMMQTDTGSGERTGWVVPHLRCHVVLAVLDRGLAFTCPAGRAQRGSARNAKEIHTGSAHCRIMCVCTCGSGMVWLTSFFYRRKLFYIFDGSTELLEQACCHLDGCTTLSWFALQGNV